VGERFSFVIRSRPLVGHAQPPIHVSCSSAPLIGQEWHMVHHAPDKTRWEWMCLAMTDTVVLLAFNPVTRVPNRPTWSASVMSTASKVVILVKTFFSTHAL